MSEAILARWRARCPSCGRPFTDTESPVPDLDLVGTYMLKESAEALAYRLAQAGRRVSVVTIFPGNDSGHEDFSDEPAEYTVILAE